MLCIVCVRGRVNPGLPAAIAISYNIAVVFCVCSVLCVVCVIVFRRWTGAASTRAGLGGGGGAGAAPASSVSHLLVIYCISHVRVLLIRMDGSLVLGELPGLAVAARCYSYINYNNDGVFCMCVCCVCRMRDCVIVHVVFCVLCCV